MLDLFSGIGGFSLAADWTGEIETVAFCEIEPFCQKVLKKHWPDVPIFSDIKELRGEDVGSVDIVCGGFPCQHFSVAGEREGKDDDRYLWPQMFRVIQESKPTWIISENVTGLIDMALEDCFIDLENEGYEVQTVVIPACAVNAHHQRDRVWILAHSERCRLQRGCKRKVDGRLLQSQLPTSTKTAIPIYENLWNETPVDALGMAHGIPNELHRRSRIHALGNSIVPQVAYQILQGIVDIERTMDNVG